MPIYSDKIIKRFWSKVDIKGSDDCWNWQAGKRSSTWGYGGLKIQHKMYYAHRIAWEITYNIKLNKEFVCHHCDNPSCVNPKHLYLGNQKTNMEDMKNRKRSKGAKGDRNNRSKLTEEDVHTLRKLYKEQRYMQKELAEMFNICRDQVWNITYRRSWKHI